MSTVREIIEDAAADIGALAQDTPLGAFEANRCLRRLQRMLDLNSNESIMCYEQYDDSFPTAAGTPSYSSSLLSSGRPIKVVGATLVVPGGTDSTITIIAKERYASIPYKTTQGYPSVLYAQMGMPNATFYLYQTPAGVYTIKLSCWRRLGGAGLTLDTSLVLPPGYEEMIVSNLAVGIGPIFGASVPEEVILAAKTSREVLATANSQPLDADISLPGFRQGPIIDMGPTL